MSKYRPPFILFALFLILSSCGGGEGVESYTPLAQGDPAPSFSLSSANGGRVALSDYAEKKPVLLYFSMGPG